MERAIDHKVMEIQKTPEMADAFIRDNDAFIRSSVRHWQNRSSASSHGKQHIGDGEDHYTISLEAFHEALQTYHFDKGSFYSFAALVIERRLIDHARKEARHLKEIPIDPYVFESGSGSGNGSDSEDAPRDQAMRTQVLRQVTVEPDDALKLEIEAATQLFSTYGFSFFDLADCSPKAQKTKSACALAVNCILESPVLLQTLQQNGQLPIKSLEKMSGVPRKILERHRKYIIAAVEIVGGDFPHLSQYMRFIREETSK